MSCYVLLSPKSALLSGAKLGKTKYIKIKNLTYTLTYISKDMVSVCHQIGGLVGLQGCGMVLYDLPAIRSVAWCGCKVVGWCSTICPPSDWWPWWPARLWGIAFLCLIVSFVIFNAQKLSYIGNFI